MHHRKAFKFVFALNFFGRDKNSKCYKKDSLWSDLSLERGLVFYSNECSAGFCLS